MAAKKPDLDEKIDSQEEVSHEDEKKELTPQEQIAELTDMLQRKQAEFANYQKRMHDQQKEYIKFASVRLIERMLPIVDMFDMAVAHKEQKDEFIVGMEMVHKQFHDVLNQEGVKIESLLGKPFDPAKAQAMNTVVDPSKPDNTIVQEMQKCYMIGERVIRHARVIVSKKSEVNNDDSKTDDETSAESN